jgi:hypothetical protein
MKKALALIAVTAYDLCGSIQMIWTPRSSKLAGWNPDDGGQPRFDHTPVDAAGDSTGR